MTFTTLRCSVWNNFFSYLIQLYSVPSVFIIRNTVVYARKTNLVSSTGWKHLINSLFGNNLSFFHFVELYKWIACSHNFIDLSKLDFFYVRGDYLQKGLVCSSPKVAKYGWVFLYHSRDVLGPWTGSTLHYQLGAQPSAQSMVFKMSHLFKYHLKHQITYRN